MSKRIKINPRINLQESGDRGLSYLSSNTLAVAPALPSIDEFTNAIQESNFNQVMAMSGMDNHYALAAYGSIYTKVSTKLLGIIKAVDDMRSFYLTDVILTQLSEDALAPRTGSDEILTFSSSNEIIQKELDDLKKRIGLDQLIKNVVPDLCAYGEYTLANVIGKTGEVEDQLNTKGKKKNRKKIKVQSNGILDVKDIVDQGTVISITQDGKTEGYLVMDELTGKVEIKELADYVKFQLGGQRIRLDMKNIIPPQALRNKQLKKIVDKIPRFLRVGKSVLYPVLSKLKELDLLEKLVPATKLNQLSQGNLVGLPLPENYDLQTAMQAAKRIEGMINKKVQVDPSTKEITVESILSSAGRTRVLPLFGDKGRIETMDFKSSEPDNLLGATTDIRELILDSIGIPVEIVYKSQDGGKADILKRHSKYLRKLKSIQKAVSEGCKQIAFIHLSNKGIDFEEEDIEVNFVNVLVEIDNLDRLEHADVTLNLLTSVRDFFNDMVQEDSPYKDQIDLDKVSDYLESNLKTVGLSDAFKTAKEGGASADKESAKLDIQEPIQKDTPNDGKENA